MGVAGAGDILRRRTELHRDGSLRNHIAGIRADDVDAQHAVGLGIGKDLHETFGLQIHLGAAVGSEGKLADLVGNAALFQFVLALPDRGDLRIGVDDVGNNLVVHVAGSAGEVFRHRHAFILRLVRQHRTRDRVADGVDSGHIGGVPRINDHADPCCRF
jgi:hypothetical protein